MKILRRKTKPCYSIHSLIFLPQEEYTCARALLPQNSGKSALSHPITKDLTWQEQPVEFCLVLVFFLPQIFSNNYSHKPKVKNAIKHWNEINYLCFTATSEQNIFKEIFKSTKLLIKYLKILKYLTLAESITSVSKLTGTNQKNNTIITLDYTL